MDPLYLCRLCLCRSESFFDIFGENVGLGFSVETAIKDLLQFDVARVEGVPSLACSTCVKDLNHFRIFKSRCVDSKVTFERRLRIREKSPPSRECGTVVSDIYDGDVAKGGRRIEESSETSEDVCGQGLLSEDSNGVSDSAEVKVKQEEDNPEEVDIPLGIVKIEHDIEQTSLHEQGMYGEELAADNGLGQSSPHGEWDLDEDAEDYGAPEGGSEISNSEETSGISGSGISSIVLLKTESLAEISTRDSEEYMEMSSMDGSANADPQPDRYSKADLKRALDEVRAGGAIRVVGRAYGIPESTIRGHLSQERLSKQEMKRKRSMALKSKQKELTGFLRGLKESGKPDEPKKLRSNEEAKSKRLNHIIGSSPPSDGLDRFGHFLERLLTGEDQNKPSQERPEKVKPRKKQLETVSKGNIDVAVISG